MVTQSRLITLWLSDVYLVDAPVDGRRGTVGELCGKRLVAGSSTCVHRVPLWMVPERARDTGKIPNEMTP